MSDTTSSPAISRMRADMERESDRLEICALEWLEAEARRANLPAPWKFIMGPVVILVVGTQQGDP